MFAVYKAAQVRKQKHYVFNVNPQILSHSCWNVSVSMFVDNGAYKVSQTAVTQFLKRHNAADLASLYP